MSGCPGLIPCATPTPGPTGLTAHEVATLGYIAGTGVGIFLMLLLILFIVAVSVAMFLITK